MDVVSFSGTPCTQQARDTRPHWYPTVRLWSQGRPCSLAAFPSRQQSQHIYRIHNATGERERKKTKTLHWLSFSRASGSMRLVFQPKTYSDWCWLLKYCGWITRAFTLTNIKGKLFVFAAGRRGRLFVRSQLTDRQRESRISVKKTNWQPLVDVIPSGIRAVVNQSSSQAANVSQGRVWKVQRVREWVFNLGYARAYIYEI